jgi:glycosyltransferase involved in cell wall biosynthesis
MASHPLVSICLPSLNTRPFLEARMASLLAQTTPQWELIVCDSYSDDGSWEFFQKFNNDSRIQLHQVPRDGLYAGWNECLKRAKGEFVYIATSDDTCEPSLLEELINPLETHANAAISVCDYEEIDGEGRPTPTPPHKSRAFFGESMTCRCLRDGKAEFLLHTCLGSIWVTMTATLFRRDLLRRIGHFNTNAGAFADHEWAMRASLSSDVAWTPKKLATWRKREGQATPDRHWTWREHRMLLQLIERVLDDPDSGLPPAWRQVPGWRDAITATRRLEMREAYGAYRWTLKESPATFFSGAGAALITEPGWALSRFIKGFPAGPELNIDFLGRAKRLLETFEVDQAPLPLP